MKLSVFKDGKNKFHFTQNEFKDHLEPGVYVPMPTMDGDVYLKKSHLNTDGIIPLPGTAYDKVIAEMETFLEETTKQKFVDNNFVYKRSFLLYGKPGSGKTVIVNRVAQLVLEKGGIVLKADYPKTAALAGEYINRLSPNQLIFIILEEVDGIIENVDPAEFLSLLDGQAQVNNMIVVATTNYIDRVPHRFLRPGRFSSVIEVGWPSHEARVAYLTNKFSGNEVKAIDWSRATDGLSIDEIKETVLAVECLGQDRGEVIGKLTHMKSATKDLEAYSSKIQTRAEEEIEEQAESLISQIRKSASKSSRW